MKLQKIPSYGHHKRSGQARVYVNGRSIYLGAYGSEASRIAYGEIVAGIVSGVTVDPLARQNVGIVPTIPKGPTINELCLSFLLHAEAYYRTPKGKPSAEVDCFKSAIKPLIALFGHVPIDDFTPLMLKTVRTQFISNGWCRGFCNKQANRLRHIYKYGVENGLVSATTWQALQAVSPLKRGKTIAPDHKRREAVSDADIDAIRPYLKQNHRDLLDLLRATGARPSELIGLSKAAIDTTTEIWVADLDEHKNAHRGLSRKLHFGPKSQLIIRRLPDTGPLFKVDRNYFANVVRIACLAAGVPAFVPYQMRHTVATEIRDTMSIEAAQAVLGHAQPSMTARYSIKLDKLAIEAAARCG